MMASMDVRPLAGSLGAEVRGLALSELDDAVLASLREVIADHHVVALPDQHIDDAQHRALGEALGGIRPPVDYLPTNAAAGHPDIAVLDSRGGIRADIWHTDVSWSDKPPALSILRSLIVPAAGGDTMWANQHSAYDRLSPSMRAFVDGLNAYHTGQNLPLEGGTIQGGRETFEATHPVVRTHPETGRKALYVNETFTRRIHELTEPESDSLLRYLWTHGSRPEFTCRWNWSAGDVVIWDNRSVQHYGVFDYTERRLMHRTEVIGDCPR
jgi:taurine dioxygenase